MILPEDGTRVDRVVNWRPARLIKDGKQPAEKMQMIVERARACTDAGTPPCVPVEIRIDLATLQAAQRRDPAKAPRRRLDGAELARAINDFHWKLLDEERRRFFADEPAICDGLARAMCFRLGEKVLDEAALRARPNVLLLRVGRFGQFESKSLDLVREGWNAQAKPARSMKAGNTRNLVLTASGAPLVPMGWLLLCPTELQPAPGDPVPLRSAAPAGVAATPRRALYQDKPVEVLRIDDRMAQARFADGDIEWVPEHEIERS